MLKKHKNILIGAALTTALVAGLFATGTLFQGAFNTGDGDAEEMVIEEAGPEENLRVYFNSEDPSCADGNYAYCFNIYNDGDEGVHLHRVTFGLNAINLDPMGLDNAEFRFMHNGSAYLSGVKWNSESSTVTFDFAEDNAPMIPANGRESFVMDTPSRLCLGDSTASGGLTVYVDGDSRSMVDSTQMDDSLFVWSMAESEGYYNSFAVDSLPSTTHTWNVLQ